MRQKLWVAWKGRLVDRQIWWSSLNALNPETTGKHVANDPSLRPVVSPTSQGLRAGSSARFDQGVFGNCAETVKRGEYMAECSKEVEQIQAG